MTAKETRCGRHAHHAGIFVFIAAAAFAALSARDYAGSWADGAHLALAQSLIDSHSLIIDHSIFVEVPPGGPGAPPSPYGGDALLNAAGTKDKLLIDGHFYSSKAPMPGLMIAAVYGTLHEIFGFDAREHPDMFCYFMVLASSGAAYAIAVWCIFALGEHLGLALQERLMLTASFALATVAIAYIRQVSNYMILLAVACAIFLNLAVLADEVRAGGASIRRLIGVGLLAGLGYTFDLGGGPILFVATAILVAYRVRTLRLIAVFLLAAIPAMAVHHAVNYAIGGTFGPASRVPEYFSWPGSGSSHANMTGVWHERGFWRTLEYMMAMLFGKRGFVGHNLALFLALPAIWILLRVRSCYRPELIFAGCYAGATWLVFSMFSNNYSGVCRSVRYLVPLLAPAYYVLAVLIRDRPEYRPDFMILTGWGIVMGALMWRDGPWASHMVPFFWPIQAAALISWATYRVRWRAS